MDQFLCMRGVVIHRDPSCPHPYSAVWPGTGRSRAAYTWRVTSGVEEEVGWAAAGRWKGLGKGLPSALLLLLASWDMNRKARIKRSP